MTLGDIMIFRDFGATKRPYRECIISATKAEYQTAISLPANPSTRSALLEHKSSYRKAGE
ncbi:hypothetical protein ACLOJK_035361 [Asimina triloba]